MGRPAIHLGVYVRRKEAMGQYLVYSLPGLTGGTRNRDTPPSQSLMARPLVWPLGSLHCSVKIKITFTVETMEWQKAAINIQWFAVNR
jgi:hypothetical protein